MAKHLTVLALLLILTCAAASSPEPRLYTAQYDVYEDGSIKAGMTSTLKKTDNNQYRLTDITEGTAGLASLLNFQRTETTDFIVQPDYIEATRHSMRQKVAFKNKYFEFHHRPGEPVYQGLDDKKPFQVNSEQPLLSTQLISWQLTRDVCHQPEKTLQWSVLKSNQAKQYSFDIIAVDNHKTLVHRRYQNRPDKSTAIWINTQDCIIEEIIYKKDDKVVRTVLENITYQTP